MRFLQITIVICIPVCGVYIYSSLDNAHADTGATVAQLAGIEAARLDISLYRGTLILAGHIASAEHKRQLSRVVDEAFSGTRTTTRFSKLDAIPARWDLTTRSLLEAVSATRSASAVLTSRSLIIRGVGTSDWHEHLERLRQTVSDSIEFDVDVVVPDSGIRVADLCARAIASHEVGPVYFEESATTLRSSAHQVLEKTISLADACRGSTIAITGHTDSSGHEPSNRRLSFERAGTVADYLAERGIARERLLVTGAGSSLPVADNGTRYGRSLNRRITLEIRPTTSD